MASKMTDEHRAAVGAALSGTGFEGIEGHIEVEAIGGIVFMSEKGRVYATPDWDQDNSLPIEAMDDRGFVFEHEVVPVRWTGDVTTDAAIWRALVEPYAQ